MGRRAYMRLIGLQQLTDFAANSGWGLMKAMMGQILAGTPRRQRRAATTAYVPAITFYGTDKDSEKRQRAAIEGFADANAITVVGWYYDKAVRGSDPATARPGFADMLAAIAADSVRTSIVETPDRFARDLAVQLAGHDHLKRLGVTLIPASAPDHFVGDELQTLIVMPPETLRRQAARRVSLRVLEERGAISLSS